MKTVVIGVFVGLVVILGVFFFLLSMADATAPAPEEVRIEISDALLG